MLFYLIIFVVFLIGVAIGMSIKQTEYIYFCDCEYDNNNKAVSGTLTFGTPTEKEN